MNVLFLAWQLWVEPASPVPTPNDPGSLVLFDPAGASGSAEGGQTGTPGPSPRMAVTTLPSSCIRLGPWASTAAAQQAAQQLAARGIDATPIALEAQTWLGHWVQISGFTSVGQAETARQRLVAGGIPDAYLMQDGAEPMLSLGVFRERSRADRVAGAAGALGFQTTVRDRYRPAVEQWLLISPRPDQTLEPADLSLASDRILRLEGAPCAAAVTPAPAAGN